jgi:hypothetical protein
MTGSATLARTRGKRVRNPRPSRALGQSEAARRRRQGKRMVCDGK